MAFTLMLLQTQTRQSDNRDIKDYKDNEMCFDGWFGESDLHLCYISKTCEYLNKKLQKQKSK